jgi:hypothetical protein
MTFMCLLPSEGWEKVPEGRMRAAIRVTGERI